MWSINDHKFRTNQIWHKSYITYANECDGFHSLFLSLINISFSYASPSNVFWLLLWKITKYASASSVKENKLLYNRHIIIIIIIYLMRFFFRPWMSRQMSSCLPHLQIFISRSSVLDYQFSWYLVLPLHVWPSSSSSSSSSARRQLSGRRRRTAGAAWSVPVTTAACVAPSDSSCSCSGRGCLTTGRVSMPARRDTTDREGRTSTAAWVRRRANNNSNEILHRHSLHIYWEIV